MRFFVMRQGLFDFDACQVRGVSDTDMRASTPLLLRAWEGDPHTPLEMTWELR